MAGGLSTRMRSTTSKHLHPLLGKRVVDWVIDAVRPLAPDPIVVVASPDTASAYEELPVSVAVQAEPRGSGDAVASARAALEGFEGDVLVLSDTPLLTPELLSALLDEHRREQASVTLLSFVPDEPFPYGRIIRDASGSVQAIVEERDATDQQREIRELNSSIYVFRAAALWHALGRIDDANAQRELYLTDAIGHIVAAGGEAIAFTSPDSVSPQGINTRAELAAAAAVLRGRVNQAHMLAGVTIVDPQATWIDAGVEIEPDVTIHPFTVLRGATSVARGAEVGPHVVAVDSRVGEDVVVGPFCYLRPGTVLEAGSKAGTFVELKNATIGPGAKVPHLSYLGDAEVGEGSNVAAGGITANFPHAPGSPKARTTIGRNVKTGIHNGFQAPVEIGDGSWIAGGTYITEDVPPESLAGFPPRQITKEGYLREQHDDD